MEELIALTARVDAIERVLGTMQADVIRELRELVKTREELTKEIRWLRRQRELGLS